MENTGCPKRFLWALSLLLATPAVSPAQKSFPDVAWTLIKDPDYLLQLESGSKKFAIYAWDTLKDNVEYKANNCQYSVQNAAAGYGQASHKFTVGSGGMRSEMKVQMHHDYKPDGIYQMEGELRFIKGAMPQTHILGQIWQNLVVSTNKLLVLQGKPDDNGTISIPGASDRVGTFKSLTNVFNDYNSENDKWLKVNIIHFRNSRKVYVYLGGELYNEYVHGKVDGDYYFKFGVYGSIGPASAEWRNVKMFEGNANPNGVLGEAVEGGQIRLISSQGATRVAYGLTRRSPVEISVHDLAGKRLAVLLNKVQEPGEYEEDLVASGLPKGICFIQIKTAESLRIIKLIQSPR